MNKKWVIIFGIIFGVVIIGLVVFWLVRQRQESGVTATAAATARIEPAAQTVSNGQSGSFQVTLSSQKNNQINSFEFYLSFDPAVVQIQADQLELDSSFSGWNRLIQEIYQSGPTAQLRISYYSTNQPYSQGGDKVLFRVPFTVIGNGASGFKFEQDKKPIASGLSPSINIVTAEGVSGNLLTGTTDGSVTTSGQATTPTPTRMPSTTPIPTSLTPTSIVPSVSTTPAIGSSSTGTTPTPTLISTPTLTSTVSISLTPTLTSVPITQAASTRSGELLVAGSDSYTWLGLIGGFALILVAGVLLI